MFGSHSRHVPKPETAKRNGSETNRPKQAKRNETKGKHRNETKPPKKSEITEMSTQNSKKKTGYLRPRSYYSLAFK